jgi:hypothetical protein
MSYETDLHEWTVTQAAALRARAANEIDWANIADEIESMGRRERRELGSRLEVLLVHLIKWRHQPELRCGSWRGSIDEARSQIEDILEDSPSLHGVPEASLVKAWHRACTKTIRETGLMHIPEACPWTIAQILDREFLPD